MAAGYYKKDYLNSRKFEVPVRTKIISIGVIKKMTRIRYLHMHDLVTKTLMFNLTRDLFETKDIDTNRLTCNKRNFTRSIAVDMLFQH